MTAPKPLPALSRELLVQVVDAVMRAVTSAPDVDDDALLGRVTAAIRPLMLTECTPDQAFVIGKGTVMILLADERWRRRQERGQ